MAINRRRPSKPSSVPIELLATQRIENFSFSFANYIGLFGIRFGAEP